MTSIDELEGLPDDPELAFIEYVARRMKIYEEEFQHSEGDYEIRGARIRFLNTVKGFHDAHSLNILKNVQYERTSSSFHPDFDSFWDFLILKTTEISVRHAYRLRKITTILYLPDNVKAGIHALIEEIRAKIISLNLREKKKEALLNALAAFSKEVDHDRTKLESYTALGLEIATASEEAGKKFKPIKDLFDSMSTVIGKAKEAWETLGLPAPGKPKQIEGPKKQLPKPDDL